MTTLAPPPSAPAARPLPGDETRIVAVFANLLPDEVVLARRLRTLQRKLVLGLLAVVAVVALFYGLSWLQTQAARHDLTNANSATATLQQDLKQYQPLLHAQAQAASINATLRTLMADDLSWRTLIDRLRKQAAGSATITGFSGAIDGPSGTPTDPGNGLPLLNASGKSAVGTITITGTAKDSRAFAAFVERLGSVHGITAALPTAVTGDQGSVTWSVEALVTSDALGGRWSTPANSSHSSNGGN